MNCYFVGMMPWRSCTEFPYFAVAILVCDWAIKKNHLTKLIEIWQEAPMEGSV